MQIVATKLSPRRCVWTDMEQFHWCMEEVVHVYLNESKWLLTNLSQTEWMNKWVRDYFWLRINLWQCALGSHIKQHMSTQSEVGTQSNSSVEQRNNISDFDSNTILICIFLESLLLWSFVWHLSTGTIISHISILNLYNTAVKYFSGVLLHKAQW